MRGPACGSSSHGVVQHARPAARSWRAGWRAGSGHWGLPSCCCAAAAGLAPRWACQEAAVAEWKRMQQPCTHKDGMGSVPRAAGKQTGLRGLRGLPRSGGEEEAGRRHGPATHLASLQVVSRLGVVLIGGAVPAAAAGQARSRVPCSSRVHGPTRPTHCPAGRRLGRPACPARQRGPGWWRWAGGRGRGGGGAVAAPPGAGAPTAARGRTRCGHGCRPLSGRGPRVSSPTRHTPIDR